MNSTSSFIWANYLVLLVVAIVYLAPFAFGNLLQRSQVGGLQSMLVPSAYVRSPPKTAGKFAPNAYRRSLSLDSQISPVRFSAASSGASLADVLTYPRALSRSASAQSHLSPVRSNPLSSLFRSDTYNLADINNPFNPNMSPEDLSSYDSEDYLMFQYDEDGPEDFSTDIVFPDENIINEYRTNPQRIRNLHQDRHYIPSGPIILAPGYGGSRLEARLIEPPEVQDGKEKPSKFPKNSCGRKYGWFGIWINLGLFFNMDCMVYAMKLRFDKATNLTRDAPGIEVRVQKDKIEKIEKLHSLPVQEFSYFGPVIKRLVSKLGYTREINIRGAPYDFRKAPNELHKYYYNFRKTIEDLFINNGYKRVSLICHSMGCPIMLYFLQRMPQIWKDFYIERLISMGAPWGGSMSAFRATLFGDNLGAPLIFEENKMNQLQRSLPGTLFLFPKKFVYKDKPLVRTYIDKVLTVGAAQSENFTLADMEYVFKIANYYDGYKMYLNSKDLLGDLDPPNVEVWCLVGKGFNTLSHYHFSGAFPNSTREELTEDGDRTVSYKSASHCKSWAQRQSQPVYYKDFNVDHMGILRDNRVIDLIERIINVNMKDELEPLHANNSKEEILSLQKLTARHSQLESNLE